MTNDLSQGPRRGVRAFRMVEIPQLHGETCIKLRVYIYRKTISASTSSEDRITIVNVVHKFQGVGLQISSHNPRYGLSIKIQILKYMDGARHYR